MSKSQITSDERLNLKKLMNELDYQDNTDTIRSLKHSVKIRDDVRLMEELKCDYSHLSAEEFFLLAQEKCSFLFNNYMDLFARLLKGELDVVILSKMLIVLKLIEDEKLDQQDGSVMVGKYLKELYLDSAVRRADTLDKIRDKERVAPVEGKSISWSEYKKSI